MHFIYHATFNSIVLEQRWCAGNLYDTKTHTLTIKPGKEHIYVACWRNRAQPPVQRNNYRQ